ncbi:hypothetical protein HOF92_04900 [bacterium]|nr:hypothetical protein [bacterium]
MTRIFIFFILAGFLMGAEVTQPKEGKQPFSPEMNETPDSMMLIWPELGAEKKGEIHNEHGQEGEPEKVEEIEREDEEDQDREHEREFLIVHREPLEEALAFLGKRGSLPPFMIKNREHKVFQQRVTLSLPRGEEPREILQLLASSYGFRATESHEVFLLSPIREEHKSSRPISLHVEKAEFAAVVLSIAKLARLSLSFSHDLPDDAVTLHWQNVDAVDGLKALMKSRNLSLDRVGDVFLIKRRSKKSKKKKKKRIIKKVIERRGHGSGGGSVVEHEEIIIKE